MNKSGKTTRKVDAAVQDFFKNGLAYLYEGRTQAKLSHKHAMEVFKKRMFSEHPGAKFSYDYGCYDGVWCYKIEQHNL